MKHWNWLQMFAEGEGDASASAPATEGATGEATGEPASNDAQLDSAMARIPERARGAFKEAYAETHKGEPAVETTQETAPQDIPQHVPYSELIKSEEYKGEHEAYIKDTLSKRFKKYEAMEAQNKKMANSLGIVANKYGLDPNSPDFLDTLDKRISEDTAYFEEYAMQHDMSPEEARRSYEQNQRIQYLEAQERQRQQEAENQAAVQQLLANAEQTKKMFPNFDLDAEMNGEHAETFKRLLYATGGDTTAAYQALHYKENLNQQVAMETQKVKQALTNSIASGMSRPMESGMSSKPAAVVNAQPNFDGMSCKQMREMAAARYKRR